MLRGAAGRLRAARGLSAALRPSALARNGGAYVADLRARGRYRALSRRELLATRRSDTVFLFGSGRSLLDVPDEEWRRFADHDTVSFREFPRQRWIRADYHVTAEIDRLDDYARRIRESPLYADTVFVVQRGWLAELPNRLVGGGLLPEGARVFRYRRVSRWRYSPPSRDPRRLVHGFSSGISVTNFAIAMGWRRIVLVGIDLYDHRYFWLDADERRPYEREGIAAADSFATADTIVDMLGRWHDLLRPEGIALEVYNPRSLLARRLPVHRPADDV